MAASQSKSSAATAVLTDILKLEELKKDTLVTRRVLATVKHILALKDKTQFELLITNLMKSYSTMLKKTRRLKLIATKRDRLWVLFHNFSLKEGSLMCKHCDIALGLQAHDIFWQLVLETKFRQQVIDTLKPNSVSRTSDPS